jgi:Zn-dependent protease with chaperone function
MTQEEFETLVRRLELDAETHPSAYRRKLGALALLGYGYIIGVLVLLFGGVFLFGWLATVYHGVLLLLKKVGWALLVLIYVVLRAMWVKFEPPQGWKLARRDYPQLFQVVDEVRAKARAPRVHHVLLTNDFNAAVAQYPRFGIFGGVRNYLILGLPLMQALSPEEFKAVMAHEFGHLSGAHGRFGAWIYRLRMGWVRLLVALEQNQHWGSALFTRFFSWYAPLFQAYSFVQARQQEYEADRVSVEAVGAGAAASALLRVNLQGDFIGEAFWPSVFRRADKEPAPTLSPFSMLSTALKQQAPVGVAQRWLGKSLQRRTGYDDTHPCLSDRLQAMGIEPYVPAPISTNAAEAFIGQGTEALQKQMDERWRVEIKQWWDERHQYASTARTQLESLNQKAKTLALTVEEQWDRARFTEEFGTADAALPLYAEILKSKADHVGALWRSGNLLLDRNDALGVEQLMKAAQLDHELEAHVCNAIAAFHRRNGRTTEAAKVEKQFRSARD